jgi:hypothetical protein
MTQSSTDQAQVTGAAGGWRVEASQVREFAAAVAQVKADLNRISAEVGNLASTATPMLGTSPTGKELSEKFSDRMGGEDGLRGQLQVALQRMEEFVRSAEQTIAAYQAHDEDSAQGLQYS